MQGVKAALHGACPQRRPGRRWPGDALEVPGPEIPELEEIAEKLSRAFRNNHSIRLGNGLQPGGKVRRLAHNRLLLGRPRADEVPNHHKPGRDPDTHLQGRSGRGGELRHRLDEGKPGPHGALGIILVGLGIAEIGEHSVAHVLGNESTVALDQHRAAALIVTNDSPQVLGIEPGRQGGRADKVAEHHGEVTAFSGVLWPRLGHSGGGRRDRVITCELPDRAEHPTAIAKQDPELLQVLVCQVGENAEINMVLCETLRIFGHAELF